MIVGRRTLFMTWDGVFMMTYGRLGTLREIGTGMGLGGLLSALFLGRIIRIPLSLATLLCFTYAIDEIDF